MGAFGSTSFYVPTAGSSVQIETVGLTPAAGFQDLKVRNFTTTGTATFGSTATAQTVFRAADGSSGAPSYSFTNSTTAGMWQSAGAVTLQSADSAAVSILSGNSAAGNAGAILIQTGSGIIGPAITIRGGTSTGGSAGTVTVIGGVPPSGVAGGSVQLLGGDAVSAAAGGVALVQGGSGVSAAGGAVTIQGGPGSPAGASNNWSGGAVTIGTGLGVGTGAPADLTLATTQTNQTAGSVQAATTRFLARGARKTLTDATATDVCQFAVANGTCVGFSVFWTVRGTGGTSDVVAIRGVTHFSAVAKSGTVTVGSSAEEQSGTAASAGALTVICDTTTGTNTVTFRIKATNTLSTPVDTVVYSVICDTDGAVTPQ